jgi:hypothetical protein
MTATLHSNGSTVAIPDVSAPVLADLVQRMLGGEPDAAERIKRGVAVLLSGALAETPTLGVYTVAGCEGRTYTTSSSSCDCPDSVTRRVTCKHQWAACLLSAMSAAARFERCQTRWLLTAKGEAAARARA